jgi:hypothetical protein
MTEDQEKQLIRNVTTLTMTVVSLSAHVEALELMLSTIQLDEFNHQLELAIIKRGD